MIEQELPMLEHMDALARGEVKPAAPPAPKKVLQCILCD